MYAIPCMYAYQMVRMHVCIPEVQSDENVNKMGCRLSVFMLAAVHANGCADMLMQLPVVRVHITADEVGQVWECSWVVPGDCKGKLLTPVQ